MYCHAQLSVQLPFFLNILGYLNNFLDYQKTWHSRKESVWVTAPRGYSEGDSLVYVSSNFVSSVSFAILTFRISVLNLQLVPILLPTRWLVTKSLSSSTKCLGCQYLLSNYWSWFHDLEVDSLVQALLPPNDLCTLGLAEISLVKLTKLQTKRKLAGWWKQSLFIDWCVFIFFRIHVLCWFAGR